VIERASASVVRVALESGRPRGDAPRWHLLRRVASREAGAGVALGHDLVLTHASLAMYDEPRYTVTTRSGRRCAAHLIHLDLARELAVLRAEGLDAPAAETGSSQALRAGHLVLALGDPFGMAVDAQPTATLGVLEGRGRVDAIESRYTGDVLLTDAPINPGSEGGALLDLEGRLVGVLAPLALDRRLEGAARPGEEPDLTGYAIPVEAALATLRVAVRPPREAGFVGRTDEGGVAVVRVEARGVAQAAGLRVGDLVVAAGAQGVRTTEELRAALRDVGEGAPATLELTVERAGARLALELRWEAP
jgi:S1-C subfamily serine protease